MLKPTSDIYTGTWGPVRERYYVRDGFIVGDGDVKGYYHPMERPELPAELAKVARGDEAGALAFARAYHLLYHVHHPGHTGQDRLEDFWRAAERVKEMLSLVGNPAAIRRAGASRIGEGRFIDLTRALSDLVSIRPGLEPIWGPPERRGPRSRDVLVGFSLRYTFSNLLEAIYWHVLLAAAGQQEYRDCANPHCPNGGWFYVTEPRQRFCPNPNGGQSLCGKAVHQRNWRHKPKAGDTGAGGQS